MEHHIQHYKLLITIVDRGKGQTATKLFDRKVPVMDYIIPGHGTAKKEILNLLGLGETHKDVVISLMPAALAETAIKRLQVVLQFDRPGSGIAFTHPIGSIGGQRAISLLNSCNGAGETAGGVYLHNAAAAAHVHDIARNAAHIVPSAQGTQTPAVSES